jgi:hypothetical protein
MLAPGRGARLRALAGDRIRVSTSESQVPHWWHRPSQRAALAPQDWQT